MANRAVVEHAIQISNGYTTGHRPEDPRTCWSCGCRCVDVDLSMKYYSGLPFTGARLMDHTQPGIAPGGGDVGRELSITQQHMASEGRRGHTGVRYRPGSEKFTSSAHCKYRKSRCVVSSAHLFVLNLSYPLISLGSGEEFPSLEDKHQEDPSRIFQARNRWSVKNIT